MDDDWIDPFLLRREEEDAEWIDPSLLARFSFERETKAAALEILEASPVERRRSDAILFWTIYFGAWVVAAGLAVIGQLLVH